MGAVLRHHIALAAPQRVLLLGQTLPPLLGLFVAAWGATRLGLSEPWVIAAAGAGFALAWLLVRWRARRVSDSQQWQPVVLRALLAAHS